MDGIKTGYIRASGFNLVASAERDGRRVIAVVFGGKTARSRNKHMTTLLDLGFTRIAERDAKRGRVRYAGIPRPPAGSGLAAPARPFQARHDHACCRRSRPSWPKVLRRLRPSRSRAVEAAEAEVVSGPPPPKLPPAKPGTETTAVAALTVAPEISSHRRRRSQGGFGDRAPLGRSGRRLRVGHVGRNCHAPGVRAGAPAQRRDADSRTERVWAPALSIEPDSWGCTRATPSRACQALRTSPMPCVIIRGLDPADDPRHQRCLLTETIGAASALRRLSRDRPGAAVLVDRDVDECALGHLDLRPGPRRRRAQVSIEDGDRGRTDLRHLRHSRSQGRPPRSARGIASPPPPPWRGARGHGAPPRRRRRGPSAPAPSRRRCRRWGWRRRAWRGCGAQARFAAAVRISVMADSSSLGLCACSSARRGCRPCNARRAPAARPRRACSWGPCGRWRRSLPAGSPPGP